MIYCVTCERLSVSREEIAAYVMIWDEELYPRICHVSHHMDTRSTDALRERAARLELLVRGPIDSGEGHMVFDRLQNLIEEVLRISEQPESNSAREEVIVEIVDYLRAELDMVCVDVALLKCTLLNQP